MVDQPADEALLAAWRTGDARAGDLLVRRYFVSLTRFFERRVPPDAVKELLQSTFVGSVESRDRVPPGVQFKAYLFGIARKQLLTWLRRRSVRAGEVALTDEPIGGSTIAPAKLVDAREEQRLLLQALQRLSPDMQLTLELFYWEDLSVASIAAVLEIPVNTVKTRLARGREQLQREIANISSSPVLSGSTLKGFERWARSIRKLLERSR